MDSAAWGLGPEAWGLGDGGWGLRFGARRLGANGQRSLPRTFEEPIEEVSMAECLDESSQQSCGPALDSFQVRRDFLIEVSEPHRKIR